ncbi:MAG: hypothetical protein ACTS3F_03010 [Phycisphaerales bacterium]
MTHAKRTMAILTACAVCPTICGLTAPTIRASGDPCVPGWEAQPFGLHGFNEGIRTLIRWNDGTGEALYAGGWFVTVDGEQVNRIARWDGRAWSALAGPDGVGVGSAESQPYTVRSMAVFDDGTGPALFVAGWFETAGGVPASNIAKWDGSVWSALEGPKGEGIGGDDGVWELAVFDAGDGPMLYAGGYFSTAGGIETGGVARWDGAAWSALPGAGGASPSGIRALELFDDGDGAALYAGGKFTVAGGAPANNLARWDGTHWTPILVDGLNGVNSTVHDLRAIQDGSDPALIVGGAFTHLGFVGFGNGGPPAYRVARWDGTQWSTLGDGVGAQSAFPNSSIYIEAVRWFDDGDAPSLFVGGKFTESSGIATNFVARWNGNQWHPLTGPEGAGNGVSNPSNAGWTITEALLPIDGPDGAELLVAGQFQIAGGEPASALAKWRDGELVPFSSGDANELDLAPSELLVLDDGTGPGLFAAGDFVAAGGRSVHGIARWDGTEWSPLSGPAGPGIAPPSESSGVARIRAMVAYDDGDGPALYAAGAFAFAGGLPARNIARWDGDQWSPLEPGPDGEIRALAVYDDGSGPALYAGGLFFETVDDLTVNHIARWRADTGWTALPGIDGVGVDGSASPFVRVYALAVYDDGSGPALYVGGDFDIAGGIAVDRIAKWTAGGWSVVSTPAMEFVSAGSPAVWSLEVHDDGDGMALYAGGRFDRAGGNPASGIARWDGVAWSNLGSGLTAEKGEPRGASTLRSLNAQSSPALLVSGSFDRAGGVATTNIAQWDGQGWSPLAGPAGEGLGAAASDLAAFDDGDGLHLFAAGGFLTAGGLPSAGIAKFKPCLTPGNPADLNNDGFVNSDDLGILLSSFGCVAPGPCTGDVDGDGDVDSDDLGLLLSAFGS